MRYELRVELNMGAYSSVAFLREVVERFLPRRQTNGLRGSDVTA